MFLINLKDYYPEIYREDEFLWVADEVYKAYGRFELDKRNAARNARRHPKNIPLDAAHALEIHLANPPSTVFELAQMNLISEALHEAISKLSKKQAKRIYDHYFLGYSKTEIAKMEDVSKAQIAKSIQRALVLIGKYYKKDR